MLCTIIALFGLALFVSACFIASAVLSSRSDHWCICPHCEWYHGESGGEQTIRPDVPYGAIGSRWCDECMAKRDIAEWEAEKRERREAGGKVRVA